MQFKKGQSGNPAGRPRGIRDRRTLLAEQLFDGEAETLLRTAIDLAKKKNIAALKMCLDRIYPELKERPLAFELPPMEKVADAVAAMAAVAQGLADGELTAGEAADLGKVVEAFTQTLWDADLEARITRLEQIVKEREAKEKK
jgi:hypothetical protein